MKRTEKDLNNLRYSLERAMYERYPSLMPEYFSISMPTCFSSYEELSKAEKSIARHYEKLSKEGKSDR